MNVRLNVIIASMQLLKSPNVVRLRRGIRGAKLMTDKDRLITKIMSLNKPTISLQTATDIVDAIIEYGVIVSPCKVGDKLYQIVDMSHTACKSFVSDFPITVLPYQINYLNLMGGVSTIPFENFGKTVFLTKEEAEEKLKELNDNWLLSSKPWELKS